MKLRLATVADIEAMHAVRSSVAENQLGDPARVTHAHYSEMLEVRGRGWVAEDDGRIVGVAIADAVARSVWALFVEPRWEGHGIGRALHDAMVSWLFEQGDGPLWLSTDPNTRAARFYLAAGWCADGITSEGEQRFIRRLGS